MPAPVYQREAGCCEVSAFTAMRLSPAKLRPRVRSYSKLMYPLGLCPRCWPLIQTSLMPITPSSWITIRLPLLAGGRVKCFRYQETPDGRKPPAPPDGLPASNGPSMLQSCGTSSCLHTLSTKLAVSAPFASPLKNRQPLSNDWITRACPKPKAASADKERNAINISFIGSARSHFPDFEIVVGDQAHAVH